MKNWGGVDMLIRGRLLMLAVPLAILASSWQGARADDGDRGDGKRAEEQLTLVKKIDVGGNGLGTFDISFVDPSIELYALSDRTNGSIDLFDSEAAKFIGRIGGVCPTPAPLTNFCFQGQKASNDVSGPDGVVIVGHKQIWAGDGDSRIKIIDIATRSFITTISTGGKARVDEMADDPRDHLLAAANNADSPPFITIFDTAKPAIVGKMIFDTAHVGVDAQNGIEQAQWSPETGLFYVSVPQVGPDTSIGGVSVIDPKAQKVLRTLLVKNCSPAGLTLGPRHQALIGCSAAFGTPATTISLVIDITSTSTVVNGAVVATLPIGGSDEVWFDKGTRHYFLAGRNNLLAGKPDPILGSVDAGANTLDPSAPTSTTAHSVAADRHSQLVFVPIGFVPPGSAAGTDPTNPCPAHGCVAVFQAHNDDGDDRGGDRD
jgi:hypothetical protein